jgi:hypothetical protein
MGLSHGVWSHLGASGSWMARVAISARIMFFSEFVRRWPLVLGAVGLPLVALGWGCENFQISC